MGKKVLHTKSIVAVGFVLIASFAIIGIALIYAELIKFSEVSGTNGERKELVVIGNTLVSMYKLEGTTNLIAGKNVNVIKLEYDSLMTEVYTQIDALKDITSEPEMTFHLDSVKSLLNLKRTNTWAMLQLLDSVETKTFKEATQTTVLSKRNLDDLNKLLKTTTKNYEDTAIIKIEKKKFFQRVKDVFNNRANDSTIKVSKNQLQQIDSVLLPTMTDTISQYVNEIVLAHDKSNDAVMRKLVARQHSMNRTNDRLTSQINQIMRDIEHREFMASVKQMKEKEVTLKRSSRIVSIIGLSALISTLLFLFLSLRSLSRNQRYRKEIEDAKKFTENLLAARERLILSITHDIKAPLSSIIGYIELLTKSKLPEKEQYYLENMQHSSEHVLQLVKNLLDFHLLESDKHAVQMMPFFPCILLRDIYQSFIPLANKENQTFHFECHIKNKEENYFSDPYRIRQIVNNLITNAIKFTQKGGTISLAVSLSKINNQQILRISIKDNGPGINDEDKEIIFEEFRRLQNYENKVVEGSGLGLAISKKLVELLKGTIEVISSPKKGSEFIVLIPIVKNNEYLASDPQKQNRVKFNKNPDKKILFIDDDIVQLNLMFELLKQEGITPILCENSLEALELLQKTSFDLVFTDIQMPGMNGFELVERIRMATFDGSNNMPIIALSGSSNISEDEFIKTGFSGFLSKPFTSDELLSVIQNFLGEDRIIESLLSDKIEGFFALSTFAGDDIQAGSKIIQSFIDENKLHAKMLTEAFEKKDMETVKKVCHKILPLMRMISATEIVAVLYDFERGYCDDSKKSLLISLLEEQIKEAESFLYVLNSN